jgi:hypothetical protein
MDAAWGEYIGFVDSDDYVDLDFYNNLYINAKKRNVEVAKGGIKEVDYKTNIEINSILFYNINNNIRKHKAFFYHSFTTAIYKKKFINNNNITFSHNYIIFEDPIFSIKVSLYSNEILIIDDIYYYYTRNHFSSSFTKFTSRHAADACRAFEYVINFLKIKNAPSIHYAIVISYFMNSLINIGIDVESDNDMSNEIRNIISTTLLNLYNEITIECWIEYFKLRENEKKYINILEQKKKYEFEQKKKSELENIRKITNIFRKK